MEFNVQDKVIIDKGLETEEKGIILMLCDNYVSIYSEYGERIIANIEQLTKDE